MDRSEVNIGWTQFSTGFDDLILGGTGSCFVCGKLTPWIEINFEGHLCSSACAEAACADMATYFKETSEPVVKFLTHEGACLVWVPAEPCVVCGKLTCWFEVWLCEHVCSSECAGVRYDSFVPLR